MNPTTQNQHSDQAGLLATAAAATETPETTQANGRDAKVQILPLTAIHVRENHNPRRIRSASALSELRESIREKGVMQSILVRPHADLIGEYELVAGETRFTLSKEIGLTTIPAVIRDLTDEELLAYAIDENDKRQDMSPLDEGRAAQTLLAAGKDKAEVCRILGWKPAYLEGRIQLTHCCEEVGQALADEQISLGHAQLLSSLREPSQKAALAAILKSGMTVEDFRTKLASMSLMLKTACFPTEDCNTCPHNSSTQATLFADSKSMERARCLNQECFDKKTQSHLDTLKAELAESYHKVAFVSEIAAGTTTVIVENGPHGVGEEQATACQGCEHFGATVDDSTGARANVTRNVCFNLPCHSKMVKAHKASLIATDAAPAPADQAKSPQGAPANPPANDQTAKPAATGTASQPKAAKKKPVVAKSAIPATVVDQHHRIHREAAAAHATDDAKVAMIVSILCMMNEASVKPDATPKGWPQFLTGENRAKAATMLDTLSVEQLTKLQRQMAAKLLNDSKKGDGSNEKDAFGSLALWVAKSRKVDLTKHFTMSADYLDKFTKPMIAQRLKEAGFDTHYEKAHGEKSFAKLVGGKKGDLIAAIKESDFDFSGFLPEGLALGHETDTENTDTEGQA